jgi:uncharacterized membrane protein YfcA
LDFLEPLLSARFAVAVAVTGLGGFTFGFAGFGGALVMTPLISLLYWPTEGVIVANLIPVAMGVLGWPGTLPHVRWREVVPVIAMAAVAAPAGVYLLLVGDADLIRRAMGVIVLAFAGLRLAGVAYRGRRTVLTSLATGGLCGAMNGAVGMGGAWASLYFISNEEASRVQRANLYITMMTVSALTVVPLIGAGAMGAPTGLRCAALALPYGLGLWAGMGLFRRTSDALYRRVALWILVGVGVAALAL